LETVPVPFFSALPFFSAPPVLLKMPVPFFFSLNNPEFYQIEDKASNASHAHEQPK
jgi:hypothetical protein